MSTHARLVKGAQGYGGGGPTPGFTSKMSPVPCSPGQYPGLYLCMSQNTKLNTWGVGKSPLSLGSVCVWGGGIAINSHMKISDIQALSYEIYTREH